MYVCVSTVPVVLHPDSMRICNMMITWPSMLTCPGQDLGNGLLAFVLSPSILCLAPRVWARAAPWMGSLLAANSCLAPWHRLLVGAPQALALPGQQANRTGGLFACPLSLEETDCYRVDIDQGGMCAVGAEWGVHVKRGGEDLASVPLP